MAQVYPESEASSSHKDSDKVVKTDALLGLSLPMSASDFVEQQRQQRILRVPDTILRGLASPQSGLARLSNSALFQNFSTFIIAINAIYLGVDVDWNEDGGVFFQVADHIFTALFTLELMIRLLHYKRIISFFTDERLLKWNIFDFVLVAFMVLETWLLPLFNLNVSLRALSSLRLLRLLRITRLFRLIPELLMMIKSLGAAFRSVSSTMVLSVMVTYIFGIILTQFAIADEARLGKTLREEEAFFDTYFGSIPKSMVTLLQISVYDDTFVVIRGTMEESKLYGVVLIAYILIGAFMILNILIGVICEIVASTTALEKDKIAIERISEVFDLIDLDKSGTITKQEYDEKAIPLLLKLGISEDLLQSAFSIIDVDSSGSLEKKEFVGILYKMLHEPTTQDLLVILKKLDVMRVEVKKLIANMGADLPSIVRKKLNDIFLAGSTWQKTPSPKRSHKKKD